ncbi:uncharacterized protein LOC21408090 isoform X4 [Morus notabilis]|uniref:uncharacterized protein LOC21408090 isoform X4 n=1 Tax=Morus notabilis TaxID=981085 RepID=UPI000CED12BF|nr:uncharacterized protein LOC21408090 isoform X4 [Morus notabilis]
MMGLVPPWKTTTTLGTSKASCSCSLPSYLPAITTMSSQHRQRKDAIKVSENGAESAKTTMKMKRPRLVRCKYNNSSVLSKLVQVGLILNLTIVT